MIRSNDNIDLEFGYFVSLWVALCDERIGYSPMGALMWMELPNSRFDGDTPRSLMMAGKINVVRHSVITPRKDEVFMIDDNGRMVFNSNFNINRLTLKKG